MNEPIDLISHAALRELRSFTRRTGQPTDLGALDLTPMEHVSRIDIDEEHVTITYDEQTKHYYNATATSSREWTYKYNEDPEFVRAVATVIDLARKHLRELPENLACPPGCAGCCSGYEPFVSRADVQRIADHFGMTFQAALDEYVVKRVSADGYDLGYLRKVGDDIGDKCIFLRGNGSGHYYCGIYNARPHDCREFTPIGCDDVDTSISRSSHFKPGSPFGPKHRPGPKSRRRRRSG